MENLFNVLSFLLFWEIVKLVYLKFRYIFNFKYLEIKFIDEENKKVLECGVIMGVYKVYRISIINDEK